MENSNKTIIITIGGLPGSGKSTLASELLLLYPGVPILSTDIIKIQSLIGEEQNPWLSTVSHQAWKLLGEHNHNNIINGFRRHAEVVMRSVILIIHQLQKDYKLVIRLVGTDVI